MTEFSLYGVTTEGQPERSETDPSEIDLGALTRRVRERLDTAPLGYVPGKTMIRNEVISELDCSAEAAETLVDALEAKGYIRYTGSREELELEPSVWRLSTEPPVQLW